MPFTTLLRSHLLQVVFPISVKGSILSSTRSGHSNSLTTRPRQAELRTRPQHQMHLHDGIRPHLAALVHSAQPPQPLLNPLKLVVKEFKTVTLCLVTLCLIMPSDGTWNLAGFSLGGKMKGCLAYLPTNFTPSIRLDSRAAARNAFAIQPDETHFCYGATTMQCACTARKLSTRHRASI